MSVHDRILTVCLVKRNTNCAIFMNSVGRVLCPRFDVVSWASPLSSTVIIACGKLFTATGYAKLIRLYVVSHKFIVHPIPFASY